MTATLVVVDPLHPPYDSGALTLAAGVAQVFVFDRMQARGPFGVTINNTGGSNAIDTTKVELARVSNTDAEYVTQLSGSSPIVGSIAHGASGTADLFDDASRFVRVTVTSTSGTTATMQATGGG